MLNDSKDFSSLLFICVKTLTAFITTKCGTVDDYNESIMQNTLYDFDILRTVRRDIFL